jgi:hypothetical protein
MENDLGRYQEFGLSGELPSSRLQFEQPVYDPQTEVCPTSLAMTNEKCQMVDST